MLDYNVDLNGRTVLVTGAAGFIGSGLSERLCACFEGIRVVGVDSITDYYDVGIKHARLERLSRCGGFVFEKGSIFCIRPGIVLKGRKGYMKGLVDISYPVAVEDSAFSLGKVVVNSLAASYGAEMIGALGISNNISGIASSFENGFSDASSSIVSQNYGAGRYDRAVKTYKANIVVTFIACFFAMTLIYTLDDLLIPIFATSRTGLDTEFMFMIKRVFVYDSLSCLGIALGGAGMDFLLGLGKTKITLLLNFIKIFVLRIPVLFILQRFISDGATALGIMMMISNCGGAIPITIICYKVAKDLLKKNGSIGLLA